MTTHLIPGNAATAQVTIGVAEARGCVTFTEVIATEGMSRPPPPSPQMEEECRGFSDGGMSWPEVAEAGPDFLRLDIDVSFKTAVLGGEKFVRMRHMQTCGTCFGRCGGCAACGKQGMTETAKEIGVGIPPGFENGNRLCIAGEGDDGPRGGPNGDPYIFVNVQGDPDFRQEGPDIYSERTISHVDAILGASIVTPVVDGLATIGVPPGTQCGQVLRLRGNGATLMEVRSLLGDHFVSVTINVDIPHDVSMEDEELLRKLRQNKLNNLHT